MTLFVLLAKTSALVANEKMDLNAAKQHLLQQAYQEYKKRLELLDNVIQEDEKTLLTSHQNELLKQGTPMDNETFSYLRQEIEEEKDYRKLLLKGFSDKKEWIEKAFTPLSDDYLAKVYEDISPPLVTQDKRTIVYPELLETLIIEQKDKMSEKKVKLKTQRVRVGGIACDDMSNDSMSLTSTCKEKVLSLVNYFTDEHYYELIPILDTKPLASFDYLKGKVPASTIHYLETMALQGIAQSRITEAKVLIRQIHGQKANIDYPLTYIQRKDRRGFALRVYR